MHKKIIILLLSLLCGLWLIGNSTYIHAKALLAQVLLETAWSETVDGHHQVKPWPWADTWPIARLSMPRLGINHIVLAGASGATLAFGPGHLFNSTPPGETGNVVISGHRDTHFAFLEELKTGDVLLLKSVNKTQQRYTVSSTHIVDKNQMPFIPTSSENQLLLVTCFPFDAIRAGGPLRYLVVADAEAAITL